MKTFLFAFVLIASQSVTTVQAQQPGALGVTMGKNLTGGALVASVVPGSPAAQIGLQPNDRILSINGQPTANYKDVMRVLGPLRAGASIELSMARGPWQGKLTAELGAAAVVFNPAQQFQSASTPVIFSPA